MVDLRSLAGMVDQPLREARSMVADDGGDEVVFRSQGARPSGRPLEQTVIGSALNRQDKAPVSCLGKDGVAAEMEMMKERFARLLLGEDMSGGGKGVSSALSLSNAITNLAASVFGEQCRLEPMSVERKARWRREIDWLLSVSDHIVEFVPSQQTTADGISVDVMVTRQRNDLLVNIPALRKLDAMLIQGYLDSFRDHNAFWYVKRESEDDNKGFGPRQEDKWWLPKPQVPPEGLSDIMRKWLHFQKESVNQVHKAAMAINAQILSEMEIPENYLESLPKNGRASLGDSIYKNITDDYFDPHEFLETLDLSTEHKIVDVKNRIEASIFIWKRKMNSKDSKTWGSVVSMEKRELFEDRAQTILLLFKHKFPAISQSTLDICKIEYNQDVGQSVLESYSRILESLAFTIMSRIDDVLYADRLTRNPAEANKPYSFSQSPLNGPLKSLIPSKEMEKLNALEMTSSMTLSDFIGWQSVDEELDVKKQELGNLMDKLRLLDDDNSTHKKHSYMERLGKFRGFKSPADRH